MGYIAATVALAATLLLTMQPARAVPIVYDWVTTGANSADFPWSYYSQLVVDSAALATGLHFVSDQPLDGLGGGTLTGDASKFISLSFAGINSGYLSMDITFNVSDGTISGSIDHDGPEQNLHLAGNHFQWSTTAPFCSDFWPNCGTGPIPWEFTGFYITLNPLGNKGEGGTQVPEPASLALLGAALFGFGIIRRRKHPNTNDTPDINTTA